MIRLDRMTLVVDQVSEEEEDEVDLVLAEVAWEVASEVLVEEVDLVVESSDPKTYDELIDGCTSNYHRLISSCE
jgi:hypothetical protein